MEKYGLLVLGFFYSIITFSPNALARADDTLPGAQQTPNSHFQRYFEEVFRRAVEADGDLIDLSDQDRNSISYEYVEDELIEFRNQVDWRTPEEVEANNPGGAAIHLRAVKDSDSVELVVGASVQFQSVRAIRQLVTGIFHPLKMPKTTSSSGISIALEGLAFKSDLEKAFFSSSGILGQNLEPTPEMMAKFLAKDVDHLKVLHEYLVLELAAQRDPLFTKVDYDLNRRCVILESDDENKMAVFVLTISETEVDVSARFVVTDEKPRKNVWNWLVREYVDRFEEPARTYEEGIVTQNLVTDAEWVRKKLGLLYQVSSPDSDEISKDLLNDSIEDITYFFLAIRRIYY